MATTLSEIRVGFHGEGAGTGELTWGQMGIWRTTARTGRTMNLVFAYPLPEGTTLAELAGQLRFLVSRHAALRTQLRFVDGPSGERRPQQVVAGSGEVVLHIADIDDGDDPAAAAEELRARYEFAWFDYENEFPVRMCVVRQSGTLAQLVVGYSHVMLDGSGLNTLTQDLAHFDRITGEATAAPPDGLTALELARKQDTPAARRQSERAIQHWAAQLDRLPAWRPVESAHAREPRWWELVAYSPAMELGMRTIAARTEADTTNVMLAAYSVAVARVFGRNPNVAQIVVSNRFRPGFASIVSQVSQHGICVVDATAATFDEVVIRAQKALTSASFYSYYDPVGCDKLLDEIAASRGEPLDISWGLNDRRGMFGPGYGDGQGAGRGGVQGGGQGGGVPTAEELSQALPRTKLFWDRKEPMFDGTLFLQIDSKNLYAHRQALAEGRLAVYMEAWTDTRRFALDEVEAFVREMEAVVVGAARQNGGIRR